VREFDRTAALEQGVKILERDDSVAASYCATLLRLAIDVAKLPDLSKGTDETPVIAKVWEWMRRGGPNA